LQTVRREQTPQLYALLEAFGRITSVPVLLNTSFNLSDESRSSRLRKTRSTPSADQASTCS